jgi:uncharacterized protein YcfJ
MKKFFIIGLGSLLLLSSCYDAAGGAIVGGQFGHVIGSAIGGITGGGRGHDLGSLIGTVGGVAAGAVIGNAAEKAHNRRVAERYDATSRRYNDYDEGYDYSANTRSADGPVDDRIYFTNDVPLEIRNAAITESMRDGKLTAGEECSVRFEIYNVSDKPIYDIHPLVEDITGNKHIKVSPNLTIENIGPHKGVRYTATILADRKLKDGEIQVKIGVVHGNSEVTSQTQCFTVPTARVARR